MLHLKKNTLLEIVEVNNKLGHIQDLDIVLDTILTEARLLSKATAGTIYLINNNQLEFSYVQNEQFNILDNKQIYLGKNLSIDNHSIAGYSAKHNEIIMIDDVYKLNQKVPYSFNKQFDKENFFQTQSILTCPIVDLKDEVIGVVQLINKKDSEKKYFVNTDKEIVESLCSIASMHIQRSIITRDMIVRMINMAALRDPRETANHVNRVGAMSAELYNYWAHKNGISLSKQKQNKGIIRLAAMLHDVGKIGVPDKILKKKGPLNKREFKIMSNHTLYGATLFTNKQSELDEMSHEIALYHHECWNGSGYPYGKKFDEIPISARIVSITDVFDALMSKRSYKEPFTEEYSLEQLNKLSGTHFDPNLISYFFDIYETIKATRNKFLSKDKRL